MNRRSFFTRVAAIASVVGICKNYPVYSYDWQKDWSDDPFLIKAGGLPRGRYNGNGKPIHTVKVNGKDVSHLKIIRLRTGRDGYIEYYPREFPYTRIRDTKTGKIWLPSDKGCPRVQIVSKDGHRRYIEEFLIEKLTGLVEYSYRGTWINGKMV